MIFVLLLDNNLVKNFHQKTNSNKRERAYWGCRVARLGRVDFQCQGVLLCWIRVGQGPTAVGAGEVVWTFLLSSVISLFFSLSLGDGPI